MFLLTTLLVLLDECKAQSNCIHDPTFPQTSLVSSLGAIQQDGYILVVNKHSHPDSKHDYTDIYMPGF
jgi:hypothetical protein